MLHCRFSVDDAEQLLSVEYLCMCMYFVRFEIDPVCYKLTSGSDNIYANHFDKWFGLNDLPRLYSMFQCIDLRFKDRVSTQRLMSNCV